MEESMIQKFYKSCNVFVTGGTGFMGKILIEKLLRSTEINTLYILIREKKGKNTHARMDELFDDVIFDRLRRECPKFKHRVEAIPGDCSITGLGLSITDRQKLISNVNIVFHVAATVRFDENIKLAYASNVNATKDIVDMARQMTNLKSIVYVSTAYSHCPRTDIEEKFYECPYTYEDISALLEKISKAEADLLTPRILGKWPNTYSFTKALAENMIQKIGAGLPLGVFRPAIVISTYKEPITGWIDNLYGPTGVCAGVLSGVLKVMPCATDTFADIVPVDNCVAALIASAWDIGSKTCERTTENITIYNYVSSPENPVIWREFIQLNFLQGKLYPVKNALWSQNTVFTDNSTCYWTLRILYHILPALLIDFLSIITGNKPRLMTVYRKIHKFSDALAYFCIGKWRFSNHNIVNLWKKMNTVDQTLFPVSITTVHWLSFFRTYIRGIRLYLLKDPESNIEAAIKRNQRLILWSHAVNIMILFAAFYVLSTLCSSLYSLVF